MKTRARSTLSLALILTLLVCSLMPAAYAQAETPDLEPIEFTYFLPYSDAKIPPDDAPVMQQLFEKTGVRIKRIVPPTEPEERLNIMLASDDVPDLILFNNAAIMRQYIDAGKLLKLNDLLEAHAPKLFNENWASFRNRIVDENGDYWYMPGAYSFGEAYIESDYGYNVRTDYFEEMGYDKAPKTMDEIRTLLEDVKTWNPDINPLGLALGPNGHLNTIVAIGASMYGLTYAHDIPYLIDPETGELIHYTQSTEIKEYLEFLNKLNVDGLLDPESPIMSAEMLKQKAVAEQIWSFIGPWWEINSEVIAYEMSVGSEEQSVVIYPTVDETVEVGTYTPYTVNMFSTGVTLTHKHKDPARYMEFIEYINTEEGFLYAQGIVNYEFTGENTADATEGYDYVIRQDYLVDGKPVFQASAWMGEMWASDENWWWNRGVEQMWDFTYRLDFLHQDTQYALPEPDASIWWDENSLRIKEQLGITGENADDLEKARGVDVSAISNLEIMPDQPEYTQLLAVRKAHETMLPRVIMAASADGFETEWENYLTELNKAGLSDVMAKYNALYQARMEAWAQQ